MGLVLLVEPTSKVMHMLSPIASLPERLRSKPTNFLGWSEFRDPMVVGIMARSGYDAILLDQQHGFHDGASCIAGISAFPALMAFLQALEIYRSLCAKDKTSIRPARPFNRP